MFDMSHLEAIKAIEGRYGIRLREQTLVHTSEVGFDVVFVAHGRVHHSICRGGNVKLTGKTARSVLELIDDCMLDRNMEFFVLG